MKVEPIKTMSKMFAAAVLVASQFIEVDDKSGAILNVEFTRK